MKIATFNINNINRRLANLLRWLEVERPDIVSLQELKTEGGGFPATALADVGYSAVWSGQRSWNGVAILARGSEPVVTRRGLPGDEADTQARYIEAAVKGLLVTSIYLPNGNPQPGPKFTYKLRWLDRLIAHARDLLASGAPLVLAGDYNVVPTVQDIYVSKSNSYAKNALVQPESRAAFAQLLDLGFTDALREIHPSGPLWTFWDYKFKRWENDKGLRLDHFLLSADVAKRLADAGVDRWVRGEDNASDHAPAWIELQMKSSAKRSKASH
jgi:exodeoxyribonuclease-3